MKKRSGFVEGFKTVVFAALVVSMVLLASTYILSTQSSYITAGNRDVFDGILSVQNDGEYGAKTLDYSYIPPEFIGLKISSGSPRAFVADDGYLFDVYRYVMPYISEMFGENGKLERLDEATGRALWLGCTDTDGYVYVRYHTEFPLSILYAYSRGNDDAGVYRSLKSDEAMIYEFFIVKDDSSSVLVARDANKNVYRFTAESAESFDFSGLERYGGRGEEFSFACEIFDGDKLADTVPILLDPLSAERISTKNVILDELGDPESESFRSLMRLFDFNPDKLNGYNDTDDDSSSVFVETHGNLRMSAKRLEYTASSDGGVSVLDFLGYRKSDSDYNISDMLKATQGFVEAARAVGEESFGGDADLGITHISYSDGRLVLEYSYFYDNVYVAYGEEGYAVRFEIRDNLFESIVVRPRFIESAGESRRNFLQKMIINMQSDRIFAEEASSVNMKLRYVAEQIENDAIDTEWALLVK